MCGIVYAHSFDGQPVNEAVFDQFVAQRHRGTEGFGLYDGQEMHMVHAAKEERIVRWLSKYDSNLILFHHRRPTSTVNVKRAAHPFSTKDYFGDDQYIMVHNGHISNARVLKEEHKELGIKYQSKLKDGTFNDSEALLWDLALTLEGKQEALTAAGQIAFVCMKLHKGKLDKLYFGRNVNPLNLFRHKEGIALSSEGNGEPIDSQTLYTYNYALNRLTTRQFQIKQYAYSGNNQGWNWENERRRAGTAGDWLPPATRRKYSPYLDNDDFLDYDKDGNPIYTDSIYDDFDGYARSKGGLYLPAGERKADDEILDMDEAEHEYETYIPYDAEVQSKALEYICQAQGNFEMAYWHAEEDYEAVCEIGPTKETIREGVLLEQVMVFIQNDPEYVDENSVSSIWEALWDQQKLAV